jgi:RimJ/RimL family protein N-acetyltransferase
LHLWFEDEELRKRLGGMLPLDRFLDYVQSETDYFAWMAWEGDEPVGAGFFEKSEPQSFGFLVRPELRGRGYGRLIARALMASPEAAAVQQWKVGIESDNIANQQCIASIGFVPENDEVDEEGFLQFIYSEDEARG